MTEQQKEVLEMISKSFRINKENYSNFRIAFSESKGEIFVYEKSSSDDIICFYSVKPKELINPLHNPRQRMIGSIDRYAVTEGYAKDEIFADCAKADKHFLPYIGEFGITENSPGVQLSYFEIYPEYRKEYKGHGVGAYALWFLDDLTLDNNGKYIVAHYTGDADAEKSYTRNGYNITEDGKFVFKAMADWTVRDIQNTQESVTLANGIKLTVYKPIGGMKKVPNNIEPQVGKNGKV